MLSIEGENDKGILLFSSSFYGGGGIFVLFLFFTISIPMLPSEKPWLDPSFDSEPSGALGNHADTVCVPFSEGGGVRYFPNGRTQKIRKKVSRKERPHRRPSPAPTVTCARVSAT